MQLAKLQDQRRKPASTVHQQAILMPMCYHPDEAIEAITVEANKA